MAVNLLIFMLILHKVVPLLCISATSSSKLVELFKGDGGHIGSGLFCTKGRQRVVLPQRRRKGHVKDLGSRDSTGRAKIVQGFFGELLPGIFSSADF
jgi:hypothetical protein